MRTSRARSKPISFRPATLIACLLAAAISPAVSRATTDSWTNTLGGNFSGANWSPAVPGSLDTALFNLANTYTVTFDTNPTNTAFQVANGNVTWITNGSAKTYTVSGNPSITGGSLTLGTSAAALTVNIAGNLSVNGAGASTPLLNVAGTNTLTVGSVTLGTDALVGHSGTITDSSNITLTGASTLTVGTTANSVGNLTLTAGVFNTGTGLTTVNATVNATGQINISGGIFNQNGDVTLTGGTLTQTSGSFAWAASHNMTIQSGGKATVTGSYSTPANAIINLTGAGSQLNDTGSADLAINNGAQLNVTTGADVTSSGFFDIASIGNGSAIFDGLGSSLTAPNPSNFIGTVGTGTLTFRNNASGSTGGFLIGSGAGSSGTLNVLSGATLISGAISVAINAFTNSGNINITGGTLTQPGTASLTLGAASLSSATVTVGTGGIYNTGTSSVVINATGLININGGTLNANGNITVSGGTLNQSNATNTSTFNWAASHTMNVQALGKVNLLTFATPANSIINVTGAGSQLNLISGPNFADLQITNGGQLNVNTGGTVTSARDFDVGLSGNGTAIADGTGSSITITNPSSQSQTVGNGGNGTLTFRNNATGSLLPSLVVGIFGGNGTLNVQSGATLTSGSLTVGFLTNAVGTADVTGGTVNLSDGIFVASDSATSGTITIGTGGLITTGNANTEVDATGLININGGTLNANGNVTVNGGTFTQTDASAPNGFQWAPSRTLTVLSGGKANFAGIFTTPAAAIINVSGAGSQFNNTPDNVHFSVALQLENGSQLNVTSGGSVLATNILQIGNTNGNGTASFDGVGTSLNAVGAIFVGGAGTGSLTISNGATATTGGLTLGNTTLASAAGAVNVTNGATLNAGSLFGTVIGPVGTLTITDSTVSLGNLTVNGGTLIFNSGSLTFGGNLTVGFGGLLGTNLTLDFSRFLFLTGTTTITPQHQLAITGGSLSTGAIVNNGSFSFTSGSLALTGPAGLAIAPGGPLGTAIALSSNQNLAVTNTVTIAPGATLFLNGGNFTASASLTNNGLIQLASPVSSFTGGTVTNAGSIQGAGTLAAPVINNATIEATGGTLLFSGPVTNSAIGIIRTTPGTKILMQGPATFPTNAGLIDLAGGTFDNGNQPLNNTGSIVGFGVLSTGGLTNNNIMTLTGGTSTINGPVTNNAGKTLNIKFQPAIFTGNITNNGTIKTTSTTVTFTGNYTGNTFISDPATNIFQANATTIAGGSMTGSTGDAFLFNTFTNNGTFQNGGTLQVSTAITNTATFTQSGPQSWSSTATFTNTSGTATFQSNAKLYGLTITAGTVDVTTSKFIIEATTNKSATLAALQSNIATHSLISSTLPSNYGLALLDNAVTNLSTFGGNPADANSLLLSPELLGDSNADGHVDLTDLSTILNNFGTTTSAWTSGNFDNAPTIDLTDLSDVLNNFGLSFANSSSTLATSPAIATPEPASLALFAVSSYALLARRRR